MSEERLQEIKDSISLQYKVQEANDLNNFNIFTDEEQELVDEIERLQDKVYKLEDIIKEVREYITYWHYRNDFRINSFTTGVKEELLEILDRVD